MYTHDCAIMVVDGLFTVVLQNMRRERWLYAKRTSIALHLLCAHVLCMLMTICNFKMRQVLLNSIETRAYQEFFFAQQRKILGLVIKVRQKTVRQLKILRTNWQNIKKSYLYKLKCKKVAPKAPPTKRKPCRTEIPCTELSHYEWKL